MCKFNSWKHSEFEASDKSLCIQKPEHIALNHCHLKIIISRIDNENLRVFHFTMLAFRKCNHSYRLFTRRWVKTKKRIIKVQDFVLVFTQSFISANYLIDYWFQNYKKSWKQEYYITNLWHNRSFLENVVTIPGIQIMQANHWVHFDSFKKK